MPININNNNNNHRNKSINNIIIKAQQFNFQSKYRSTQEQRQRKSTSLQWQKLGNSYYSDNNKIVGATSTTTTQKIRG
jgi:hypothetical protein